MAQYIMQVWDLQEFFYNSFDAILSPNTQFMVQIFFFSNYKSTLAFWGRINAKAHTGLGFTKKSLLHNHHHQKKKKSLPLCSAGHCRWQPLTTFRKRLKIAEGKWFFSLFLLLCPAQSVAPYWCVQPGHMSGEESMWPFSKLYDEIKPTCILNEHSFCCCGAISQQRLVYGVSCK